MTHLRKHKIAHNFSHADHYDHAANIQKQCAQHLMDYIKSVYRFREPNSILEFGCGTGFLSSHLTQAYPHAETYITDISLGMLHRVHHKLGNSEQRHFCLMDAENPTFFPNETCDLITSSLCLQWFENRPQAFKKLIQKLRPGGTLIVTTLTHGSLNEWRHSCNATKLPCGVPHYPTLGTLQQEWPVSRQGEWSSFTLKDPVHSAHSFLHGLRTIGAVLPHSNHIPSSPSQLRKAMKWFDAHYCSTTYNIGLGFFQKEK